MKMKPKKPAGTAPGPAEIAAASFPALRQFLRGYLHEDWMEDYETPAEAARQFCEDADPGERSQVAREWLQFYDRVQGQPLPTINRLLKEKLGSVWNVQDTEEMDAISTVFRGEPRPS